MEAHTFQLVGPNWFVQWLSSHAQVRISGELFKIPMPGSHPRSVKSGQPGRDLVHCWKNVRDFYVHQPGLDGLRDPCEGLLEALSHHFLQEWYHPMTSLLLATYLPSASFHGFKGKSNILVKGWESQSLEPALLAWPLFPGR